MAKIRIQKALSDAGFLSRRKAEEYITEGKITVNGRPIELGCAIDPARDVVAIEGQKLIFPRKKENVYLMLNKPRGFVTTTSDELGRRCVTELVTDVGTRVYPVGRLDKNSEGLLLFTNDGNFANLMMHPRSQVSKTYRVTVRPDVTEEMLIQLSTGVDIGVDGETEMTLPATVHVVSKEPGHVVLQISITEGKNRQIRRMCEAVGLEVARLKRISEGPLQLGMLQPGKWRMLKNSEVTALRNAARPADAPQEKVPRRKPDPANSELRGSFGSGERRGERRKDHFLGKHPSGIKGSPDLKKRLSLLEQIEEEAGPARSRRGQSGTSRKPHSAARPVYGAAARYEGKKPSGWQGQKPERRSDSRTSDSHSARRSGENKEIRPSRRGVGRNLGGKKKW